MSGFSTCPTITRLYYLSASRVHTCSSDPDWPMLLLSLWLRYSINHDLLVPHRLLHYPREYTIYHSINEFLHGFSKNKKYLNWKWEDKIVFASSVRYTSNNHLWTIDKKKGGKKEGKKDRCFFFFEQTISLVSVFMLPLRHPSFYFRNHIRARDSSPSVRTYTKACSVIYLEQPCLEYEIGRGRNAPITAGYAYTLSPFSVKPADFTALNFLPVLLFTVEYTRHFSFR